MSSGSIETSGMKWVKYFKKTLVQISVLARKKTMLHIARVVYLTRAIAWK